MPEVVQQRIVPGAPEPQTKVSKRRRKAKQTGVHDDGVASVAEVTPAPPAHKILEPEEGLLTVETTPQPEAASPLAEEGALLSPIVELVNKRLKVTTKKIGRATIYAATDDEKLNDDQKRILKQLPTLEAIQKELGEVKKTIENYEADLAHELAAKRVEGEKAENARIKSAVESTKADLISRTSDLLGLVRLRQAFATGAFDGNAFFADELERGAIYAITNALVGEDIERKDAALNGLLLGTGSFDGVAFSRISEIIQTLINPPRIPTPTQESTIDDRQQSVSAISEEVQAPPGLEASQISSSFHFMQESELDPESNFEETAEWVEKPIEEVPAVVVTNGHAPIAVGAGGSTLDWSAEGGDTDLPPIESLGPSGSATPAEEVVTPNADVDGASGEADDGFTSHHRGGRGGRGRRGEHGEYRGERRGGRGHHFRGGERGGFRGDRGGGYRGGERGERGGHRGPGGEYEGRGGFRGGERGGDHEGGRGGYRGGDRGDRGGEHEGGRGEGGYRGFRGGDRGGGFRGGRGGGSGGDWRSDGERGGRGRGRGRPDRGGAPSQGPGPETPTQA